MSLIEIPIPADTAMPDALRIVNRELTAYACEHRTPRFGWGKRWFPLTRLLRFEPNAVVYEVEDVCDTSVSPQAAACRVAETKTVNRPCGDAGLGYGAAVGA